ncbi:MAG: radical SAM protein [Desulfobacter sp.]|nr:MAG: radical SAM protein [Desulfobacter sp.]
MKNLDLPKPHILFDEDGRQFVLPDFPERVTLELSFACNLNCVMCPRNHLTATGGFMDWNLFEKIILELEDKEIKAIVPFFRGESLLHPRFRDMIRLIREKTGAQIQLATNGLLLDGPMADFLLDVEIDFISFSIDAFTGETYEKVRQNNQFEQVMDNIEYFLSRRNCRQVATTVQASATANAVNRHEIDAFVSYWKKRADRVRIYPEHSADGEFGALPPELDRDRGKRQPCRKLFSDMVILWDGQISACNHDWEGRVLEAFSGAGEKTLGSLWKGQAYDMARKKHLAGAWGELSPCGHCSHWQGWNGSRVGALIQ